MSKLSELKREFAAESAELCEVIGRTKAYMIKEPCERGVGEAITDVVPLYNFRGRMKRHLAMAREIDKLVMSKKNVVYCATMLSNTTKAHIEFTEILHWVQNGGYAKEWSSAQPERDALQKKSLERSRAKAEDGEEYW